MKLPLSLLLIPFSLSTFAQLSVKGTTQKDTYDAQKVLDERYGIDMYEKLNQRLAGDSVRMCGESACSGWIQDYYTSGELLHKGYYSEGQLVIYKNFYPNGNLERDFKITNDYKCVQRSYYENGNLKSEVKYLGTDPLEWTDYFENGNMEYHEAYDNKLEYYTERQSYYENGNLKNSLQIESKKKRTYIEKNYFESGNVQSEGEVVYFDELMDYIKRGVWKTYNEAGTLIREEEYVNGKVVAEKDY